MQVDSALVSIGNKECDSEAVCRANDTHVAIEALFQDCVKLQESVSSVTIDEVEALSNKMQALELEISKKIEGRGKPIVRLFSRLRMFSEYFKIIRVKNQIRSLRTHAEKSQEQSVVEKIIWQITRKGFISSLSDDELKKAFSSVEQCLRSLDCTKAFVFRIASRENGEIDFSLYENQILKNYKISLTRELGKIALLDSNGKSEQFFDSIDLFLTHFAKEGICLSQLQDVSLWFETHGVSYSGAFELKSKVIEEKLSKLMDSCPHGAYIMYPAEKGTLKLSRLLHYGNVHHVVIDLTKQPGSYTFNLTGSNYSASRSEFKRKLEQMGTPLKLKS